MTEKKPLGRPPRDRSIPRTFTPLEHETRTHISTEEAAHHLRLAPQTLRAWSCFGNGPIKPVQSLSSSPLRWPVSEIAALLAAENLKDPAVRKVNREKSANAQAVARGIEWKTLAKRAINALEKWERAAKTKDKSEMDAARSTRDAVLKDFRSKTGIAE